jgi:hypothetical protein
MKNQNVPVALIVAVALLISAFVVATGFKSFGRSLEKAAYSISNGLSAQ